MSAAQHRGLTHAIIFVFFTLVFSQGFSQTPSGKIGDRIFYELDGHGGLYLPHPSYGFMKKIPQFGADFRVGFQTDGSKDWERSTNYIDYGAFIRFEKNNVDSVKYSIRTAEGLADIQWKPLGDCIALGGFLNGHFYRGRIWSLDYGLMTGFAFMTRHGNELMGSPLNVYIAVDFGPSFVLSEHLDLNVRFQFSHVSNTSVLLPNYGINVANCLVGLRYRPHGHPTLVTDKPYEFKEAISLFASESAGLLQTNESLRSIQTADGTLVDDLPQERPHYFCNMLQFGMHHQFRPILSYSVALDLMWTGETKRMYDKAHQNYNDAPESFGMPLVEYSFARSLHAGLSAMFEVNYGNFAIYGGIGCYLWHGIYYGTSEKKSWNPFQSALTPFETQYLPRRYTNTYERFGVKYYLGQNRRFYVGCTIKAHHFTSDYAEVTFGVKLFEWEGKQTRMVR